MTENEAIKWQEAYRKTYNHTPKEVDEACDMAIQALEEVQEYHKIGTVDECKVAVEKQKPKMPIKDALQYMRYTSSYVCPSCGRGFTGAGIANYCYHCGQRMDWSD